MYPISQVYNKDETYNKNELYTKNETYTKTEVNNVANNYGAYWGNPIGTLISFYGINPPIHYLACHGQWYNRTLYPQLYNVLQSDYLPDFRECAIVGTGYNTTYQMGAHDEFTLGEFKDDQLQDHQHGYDIFGNVNGETFVAKLPADYWYNQATSATGGIVNGRFGIVTRGKRKGALICIRAE